MLTHNKTIVLTSSFLPGNLKQYSINNEIPILVLNQNSIKSILPKRILLINLLKDSFKLIRNIGLLKTYDSILSVYYITIPLLFIKKIGIISKGTNIYWADFFLHNPKFFYFFGGLLRFLLSENDKLIVYSNYEISLYSKSMNINPDRFHYIPLVYSPPLLSSKSEFSKRVNFDELPKKFVFAGGYSNRDYQSLIDAFTVNLDLDLVICSSRLNHELKNVEQSANVHILNDVHRLDFLELIKRSVACILLIKNDSGAAGQLFALECMYHYKPIIATNTNVLSEIILDKVCGFLINSPEELSVTILKLTSNDDLVNFVVSNAKEHLTKNYSEEAFNSSLDTLLMESTGLSYKKKVA